MYETTQFGKALNYMLELLHQIYIFSSEGLIDF